MENSKLSHTRLSNTIILRRTTTSTKDFHELSMKSQCLWVMKFLATFL